MNRLDVSMFSIAELSQLEGREVESRKKVKAVMDGEETELKLTEESKRK